mgnify:CR=1 FL=1
MIQERQFILKGAEFCYPNASEKILKGIDLEIRAGEWVALLGSNGSGKSTLLKLLSALLIPTQGLCFVGGTDTSEAKGYELRGISAIVFQNPEDQIVASTVEEEVAFGPENLGCPPEEILARLEEALAATGGNSWSRRSPEGRNSVSPWPARLRCIRRRYCWTRRCRCSTPGPAVILRR